MNTGTFLTKVAQQRPDAVAIRHGDRALTYREFADRCLRLAGALRAAGLESGDRVAVVQSNRPELLESMYATFMAGMAVVPINMRLHPKEVAYIVDNAGAKALIHSDEFNDGMSRVEGEMETLTLRVSTQPSTGETAYGDLLTGAEPLDTPVDVEAEDLAWLFYTSGTTGRPKGVMWTHRTVRVVVMNYLADVYNMQPEDVVLHAAPLSHGSGVVALPAIAKGAENIILESPSFEPSRVFDLIEGHQVTNIAFLAPTQIVKLLNDYEEGEWDLSSLRGVCYGGAPMYVEDLKRAIDVFGPIWVQIFGQGEAPLTISYLRREDHATFRDRDDDRLGSAGIARTDVEIRIGDEQDQEVPAGTEGEILVRGDIVMPGYWENPEATNETLRNGWLHTGDIGRLDENGYLYILDRAKDMIISGGNNIYPREVEEVILTHPDVLECTVFGVPDDYWGESVHALVVVDDDTSLTESDIVAWCKDNLASYKKPRSVEFRDELPKSAYGKILKREVREPYWEGHDRRVGGGGRA